MTKKKKIKKLSCSQELALTRESIKEKDIHLRLAILSLVFTGMLFVGSTLFFVFQNNKLRAENSDLINNRDNEGWYKNYDGSFYTLLSYDIENGDTTNLMNVTTTYDEFFYYYINKTHPLHNYTDADLVLDVLEGYCVEDSHVTSIATSIKGNCTNPSDLEEVANAILSFVQDRGDNTPSIQYVEDIIDMAQYPVETLVKSGGDCEDKSILYATLLKTIGFNVALVLTTEHCLVAVSLPSPPMENTQPTASSIEISGNDYYFAETTGYGWLVGDLPPDFSGETFHTRII